MGICTYWNLSNELVACTIHFGVSLDLSDIFSSIKSGKLEELEIPERLINAQTQEGYTPLIFATVFGTPSDMELLLALGADKHLTDNWGVTAKGFASLPLRNMNPLKLKLLLE